MRKILALLLVAALLSQGLSALACETEQQGGEEIVTPSGYGKPEKNPDKVKE